MEGNRTIFVPSIPHTGVWFLLEFLMEHSEVFDQVMEMRNMLGRRGGGRRILIHSHFGQGVTHHPDDTEKFIRDKVLLDLIGIHPIVTTVRDPLLSIITRQLRHPDLWHTYIINGFMVLAEQLATKRADVFIFPVDLYRNKSYEARLVILRQVLNFLNLAEEPYVKFWAAAWPRFNSVGYKMARETRRWYKNRQVEPISYLFLEEYRYLQAREKTLRPVLERLGYRDLLWWSK